MPLGRICPACSRIYTGSSCPCGGRPGGKRLTARRQLNQKVWASAAHQRQRRRILSRDDYTCQRCGRSDDSETGKGLVADHRHGIDMVREFDDDELETLCTRCSGKKDGQKHR